MWDLPTPGGPISSTPLCVSTKRALAPSWQAPHVVCSCCGATLDAGLDGGRISCALWQSAQAATRVEPSCVTLPWNVRANEATTEVWHVPHSAVTLSCEASVSTRWIAWAV